MENHEASCRSLKNHNQKPRAFRLSGVSFYFLFNIGGGFEEEHVVHLLAAHVLGVEAVVGFDDEAFHWNVGCFGEEEFRAAVVSVRVVGAIENCVHLVGEVSRDVASASPVFVDMAHVLVGDVIGRSAEVGACLAVDVVKADGVGLGFQYISCAVSDAVVEGVRALVVQRKLSHVLDVFSVDVPHRGDVVLSCKAVSSDDVADWSDGSHAVDMEFILLRFLVDVGCVSNRYIFIFAHAIWTLSPIG